jgi:GST-like protein
MQERAASRQGRGHRMALRGVHAAACNGADLFGAMQVIFAAHCAAAGGACCTREALPMTDLSAFPITKRWPAQHPDRIQLYSLPTPNGVKVSIALEELGLPYEPHLIDIGKDETWGPEFLSLNPNGKIPAIIDPNGPGGKPLGLFESGAILVYLAEKTGKLMSSDPALRYETLQWVFFQMAAVGPMFGQLGFFHRFAGKEYEDKRPRDRYANESKRLLGVLETRLAGRDWIMGDEYSIADIALLGWVRNINGFYDAGGLVDYASLKNVPAWLERGLARPAVQRGLDSPKRG